LSRVIVFLAFSIVLNYVDRSTLSIAATLLKENLGLSSSQFGKSAPTAFLGEASATFWVDSSST
jgi:hypothetical protein